MKSDPADPEQPSAKERDQPSRKPRGGRCSARMGRITRLQPGRRSSSTSKETGWKRIECSRNPEEGRRGKGAEDTGDTNSRMGASSPGIDVTLNTDVPATPLQRQRLSVRGGSKGENVILLTRNFKDTDIKRVKVDDRKDTPANSSHRKAGVAAFSQEILEPSH